MSTILDPETPVHTHPTTGGTLTHRHGMGEAKSIEATTFDDHIHLVVLAGRNWVNEYTGPPVV